MRIAADTLDNMSNRREFFKEVAGATAGIVFSGCSLLRAAQQSGGAAKRRQVMVGGKRVKTIDVHAHCNVPEAMALMPNPPNGQNLFLTPERVPDRLALMDQQGTDIEALSVNPFWYGTERDLARQIIKIQNEKLAELCAAHPDRFVAYATVALQHPDLAVEQLEEGVKKLGLRGASVGGSVNGEELAGDRDGHRLAHRVDQSGGRSHPGHAGVEQRRQAGDPGRQRGQIARNYFVRRLKS